MNTELLFLCSKTYLKKIILLGVHELKIILYFQFILYFGKASFLNKVFIFSDFCTLINPLHLKGFIYLLGVKELKKIQLLGLLTT